MHDLQAASSATEDAQPRILLDGPSGSGKSVAVAAQVARARAGGALVLYVPSAFALIQDAFFSRCGWVAADRSVVRKSPSEAGLPTASALTLLQSENLTVTWSRTSLERFHAFPAGMRVLVLQRHLTHRVLCDRDLSGHDKGSNVGLGTHVLVLP